MEGKDVGKVVQVYGPDQANEKLAEGWELLAVVPAQDATGQVCVAYVLGKRAERTGLKINPAVVR